MGQCGVVVSAFQSAERFTELTHRRYTLLAADAAFVAALSVGMPPRAAPSRPEPPRASGARPSAREIPFRARSVVVLGPHFAAALVAVEFGDDGPDMQRDCD